MKDSHHKVFLTETKKLIKSNFIPEKRAPKISTQLSFFTYKY